MLQHAASAAPPRRRPCPLAFIAVSVGVVGVLAALLTLFVNGTFATAIAPLVVTGPYEPTADDGLIRGDSNVTLLDEHVPAIGQLDPALRDAMRQAETDAAMDGIAFQVTSGWRSAEYQRWLLDDAIRVYGSEEVARQYVASPESSSHVTGHGIDIGPVDAQFWLISYGSRYGICQTYANERWHFELATEPGGVCPEMKMDAAS